MQDLARDGYTADQVRALLTADSVEVSAGCDLIDASNVFVDDISDDFDGGSISHDNYATVHGSCRLSITRALTWGKDRVRPWMTVGGVRFNLGVYVLTTPDTKRGEEPITYDVTGYDLLHLLQDGPGDTYTVVAGTTYTQAVRDVITASGIGARVLLDGTRQDATLPATRVWALTGDGPSWLSVVNDLLREIGYDGIHADEDGNLRSGPFQDPAVAPSEWTFDTSDPRTNIVHEDRTETEDVWGAPNHWRFVRSRMDTQPVEGDGIYAVTNQSDGPTSIDSLGRTVRKVVFLDAADQATLEAQGDKIVTEDRQVAHEFDLTVDPLPAMGHRDVVTLVDAGSSDKMPVASWSLNLNGSPGHLKLGGGRDATPEPMNIQATATVTNAAELRVVVDGATVDSFANALDAATYAVGQRVTVTLRNPLPPLIQGAES